MQIPLTRGLIALVDAEDAELVGAFQWHIHESTNGLLYARRETRPRGGQLMHSLILAAASLVDHRNGNGLDNRRANLRAATASENMRNRRKLHGRSDFKGVSWCERDECWRARITVDGDQIHLGRFPDQQSAALAYDAAARTHFGEFAALNFPAAGEQPALSRASI